MKQWFRKALVTAIIPCFFACGDGDDRAISSITVGSTAATISVGSEQQYKATATFTDHSIAEITSDAQWTSSDQSIAAIDSTGRATGVAEGAATLKATVLGVEGSSTLTVSSVKVTPLAATIGPGETVQFNATETFAPDPTKQDITMQVTWTSSDTSIVTIDKDGRATGVGVYDDPIVILAVASDGRSGFAVVRAAQAGANDTHFGSLCVRNFRDDPNSHFHRAVTVDYDLWYLGIKTSAGFCVPETSWGKNMPTCRFNWGGSVGEIRVNMKQGDCSSATEQIFVCVPPGPWMPYDEIWIDVYEGVRMIKTKLW